MLTSRRCGATVYPYRWKDATAAEFADSVGAFAASRAAASSFAHWRRFNARHPACALFYHRRTARRSAVLTGRTPTLAGCLRNAEAVARAAQAIGPRIAVIPAGERWPDGSLRPCLEDWLGAGAIIRHLFGSMSPETNTAREVYELNEHHLTERIHSCTSGRELIEQGWEEDVRLASEIGTSKAVPMLIDGAYRWPDWSPTTST